MLSSARAGGGGVWWWGGLFRRARGSSPRLDSDLPLKRADLFAPDGGDGGIRFGE